MAESCLTQSPTWLDLAHMRLDEAVCAAYGWNSNLSDEEILEKLLALNLERAKGRIGNIKGLMRAVTVYYPPQEAYTDDVCINPSWAA